MIKTTVLPVKVCELGYPRGQIADILGDRESEFWQWMRGQTMSVCDGSRYNPESKSNEPTNCGPHGGVVYGHDLTRFLDGLPVID